MQDLINALYCVSICLIMGWSTLKAILLTEARAITLADVPVINTDSKNLQLEIEIFSSIIL